MPTKPRLAASIAAAALLALAAPAHAVSPSVRSACMSDYFAYCSNHAVGSASLRSCMKSAGPKLSKGCVNALVGAGEISTGYVQKRKALAGAH
jgi:hypothetical protein